MGGVHQLVPQHDGHLVVVHGVEQAAVDEDRAVGGGHGVPLLVVDHVDPEILLVAVGRHQVAHDVTHALDLGAARAQPADVLLVALLVLLPDTALVDELLLDLVEGLAQVLLEQGVVVVGPGLQLAGLDHAVAAALALGLDLVAQRDRGEVLGFPVALELGAAGQRHALAVHHQQAALLPLGVALDLDLTLVPGRGRQGRDRQGRRQNQDCLTHASLLAACTPVQSACPTTPGGSSWRRSLTRRRPATCGATGRFVRSLTPRAVRTGGQSRGTRSLFSLVGRRSGPAPFVVTVNRGRAAGPEGPDRGSEGRASMRFMMIVKATRDSEAGVPMMDGPRQEGRDVR